MEQPLAQQPEATCIPVPRESLVSVLGVVYSHRTTSDGGDLYLTQFGLCAARQLEIENWFEKDWFEARRVPLPGTGAVYRVPTREVDGRSIDLVVKNCRVGEHVPLDTHAFLEFVNAEFNSPWEEFALVMELREGQHGPEDARIGTQEPLAIYVPPERMQLWQSGRSRDKIDRINARRAGLELDILRQYKMVYGWIHGKDIVELFAELGLEGERRDELLEPLNRKVVSDLEREGFVIADMKPAHIIVDESRQRRILELRAAAGAGAADASIGHVRELLERRRYSVVDYELLVRTQRHEEDVKHARRWSYLDDQRDRFRATPMPPNLGAVEILGVPYVHGRVESTGGRLWVVGRNARLFDYFLPERWRKTTSWKLSEGAEEFYTVTKDDIHLIWKVSRVGAVPQGDPADSRGRRAAEVGFNSPFEEFAVAQALDRLGVPTVYMRAIYSTGYGHAEAPGDRRRYDAFREVVDPGGEPVLDERHAYVCLRGYYTGSDTWVAEQRGRLCRRISLPAAAAVGMIPVEDVARLAAGVRGRVHEVGYDGSLLEGGDLLLTIDPDGKLLREAGGGYEVRICNFELITKRR